MVSSDLYRTPNTFYIAIKIDNSSASEMYGAIHQLNEYFPKNTFKTYTVDCGKEV
ncbi:hypothetical protein [Turicibacter sanguinis]|uniref:hypothetical protein n=1 Tax=Turicibacter sanguinis TaxID=154288 RepID=UPI001E5CC2F9|nr:hypothetical protein [Turicibacter sanguinis]MDB8558415.1 hypothetical protein [Turicibacter sanguinis]MDB8561211.1 hypothetical protein [Turicibacter sanguinis]